MASAAEQILTAVVNGLKLEDPNVKLAAVKTLTASLEFTDLHFKRQDVRDYLMQVIIQCTAFADPRVRRAAFECLVRIATLHYAYLETYIKDIFDVTWRAIREDQEPVALQAVEFWSSVCDEELELMQVPCVSGVPLFLVDSDFATIVKCAG